MLIPAAILSILVYGVTASMLGTIMPTFTGLFKLTGEQNGSIALAQGLGLVLASITAGPLIDLRGKKIALIGGSLLITGSLAALPSAGGATQLMVLYFVLGLGGGIIVTAANSLASDIHESRRASTLNFLNLFFGLGGLLTPLAVGNFFSGPAANKLTICYLGAAFGIVALGANIAAEIPPASGSGGFKMSEAGDIVRRPVLYVFALFLFLYVACEVGVWNWLASYLISRKIEESTALNILSLGFALGLLIGRIVASRILIKVSSITVTSTAAILMAATTFMMLQLSDAVYAWITVFCAGLAMAPVFPTTLAMVADTFPRGTATAMGIAISSGWLGLLVSSPIIGAIAGPGNMHLGRALLLLPAFSIAMVLLNLALRPMLARKTV